MLKGVLLGTCAAVFATSLIFLVSGIAGGLEASIITGNIIGRGRLISYSALSLILSFIAGLLIILRMRKA